VGFFTSNGGWFLQIPPKQLSDENAVLKTMEYSPGLVATQTSFVFTPKIEEGVGSTTNYIHHINWLSGFLQHYELES